MPPRNALNGVLAGFLGTYTSRNSDYEGWWLLGHVVLVSTGLLHVALLGETAKGDSVRDAAERLAREKFIEQLQKAGLLRSSVRDADLRIDGSATPRWQVVGEVPRFGVDLRFEASAVSDHGRRFVMEQVVFVSPHDPRLERRSTRGPA